jgi:hypothetical protein
MAPEDSKRKLTTVYTPDAVGYSRPLGDDELSTKNYLTLKFI